MIDVCIIGGGPSGMMAAISSRLEGNQVLLLEKNDRLGKKILVTGNGRCNYTNLYASKEHYNNDFVDFFFKRFSVDDAIVFFRSIGIEPLVEGEGRCYPSSEQAQSIVDCLEHELIRLGIEVSLESEVLEVEKQKKHFEITLKDKKILCKHLIITTGGITYTPTGSSGDGYRFAKKLGHTLTPLIPSLSRLYIKEDLKELHGVRFYGKISVIVNNQTKIETNNDFIISKSGLGGLGILEVSKIANQALYQKKEVSISVELTRLSQKELMQRFKALSYKTVFQSLIGLINKKLILPVLKRANIKNPDALVTHLTEKELNGLIYTLKDYRFVVTGNDFNDAQVTSGGISLKKINPKTLESMITKNLYFAGEVLDIDGKSGGYNLQWAYSSGYVAGKLGKYDV